MSRASPEEQLVHVLRLAECEEFREKLSDIGVTTLQQFVDATPSDFLRMELSDVDQDDIKTAQVVGWLHVHNLEELTETFSNAEFDSIEKLRQVESDDVLINELKQNCEEHLYEE